MHGGPGQGIAPGMRRMFGPARYRAVLFDQRGCGRSTPQAGLLTGGSWDTTLALLYAERCPHRVSQIMLSGITATRHLETDWLDRGVGRFFPEE